MVSGVVRNALQMENLFRMGIVWTIVAMVCYMRLLYHYLRGSLNVFPRQLLDVGDRRRACVVTGASSGIGKAAAKALAMEGYHVILAGKSSAELQKAAADIRSECSGISLHWMELDLCSVSSIQAFVMATEDWISVNHHELQLLVNNAGILAASQSCTFDGYDRMMATNYLGPFLLTKHLLPLLERSSQPARVVNVVSFTHYCVRRFEINDNLFLKGVVHKLNGDWYRMAHIYEASKVCLLLFSYELHRQLHNTLGSRVTVMAADPGIVKSSILQELPHFLVNTTYFALTVLGLLQSPDVGARAIIDAALAPAEISGRYFFGGHGMTLKSSDLSYNSALSDTLYRWSTRLCDAATARSLKDNHNSFSHKLE